MPKGRRLLLAALAAVAVIEAAGIRSDRDTISGLTADLFHVDTRTGRAAFVTAWLALAAWYARHVLRFARSVKAAGSNTEANT